MAESADQLREPEAGGSRKRFRNKAWTVHK
jgi:hypothetical protein